MITDARKRQRGDGKESKKRFFVWTCLNGTKPDSFNFSDCIPESYYFKRNDANEAVKKIFYDENPWGYNTEEFKTEINEGNFKIEENKIDNFLSLHASSEKYGDDIWTVSAESMNNPKFTYRGVNCLERIATGNISSNSNENNINDVLIDTIDPLNDTQGRKRRSRASNMMNENPLRYDPTTFYPDDFDDDNHQDQPEIGDYDNDEEMVIFSGVDMKSTSAPIKQKPEKKKTKPKKDPLAPKGPLVSFMVYSLEVRPKIHADDPSLTMTDVSRQIGQRWKELSPEEREPYEESARRDRERYGREMKIYKENQQSTTLPLDESNLMKPVYESPSPIEEENRGASVSPGLDNNSTMDVMSNEEGQNSSNIAGESPMLVDACGYSE